MAKARSTDSSTNSKKANRPQTTNIKDSGKKTKGGKASKDVESQILSLGGEEGDLELFKGVQDGELVQGSRAEDVSAVLDYYARSGLMLHTACIE